MLTKQVQFFGKTEEGIFCQSLFGSAGAFEKTAGAPPFADWSTGDTIRKFVGGVTKKDRDQYCYVLVNALGAGEYFGSNINSDYFPWNSLAHEGDDYGYKTFLRANAFQHHVNKDPTRGFGVPVLSLLNPQMKRVELVIRLDRAKAKAEGADGIITRIDAGEFPDVSMGCKVPYDVCSICGNRSKTKDDYCQHMKPPEDLRGIYGPNRILPDGRKIYVLNTFPRFFDISFVFIGADKTAKVMAKLASVGGQNCLGNICSIPRPSAEVYELSSGLIAPSSYATEKTASAEGSCDCGGPCCGDETLSKGFGIKLAAKDKAAEIIKSIPAGAFSMKKLPELERTEPSIPTPMLDELAGQSVGSACSSAGMLGMVFKPREFQRIVLIRMGEHGLADELDRRNMVFRKVPEIDDSIPYDRELLVEEVIERLLPLLAHRSAFGAPFRIRAIRAEGMKKSLPTETPLADSLLDKISAAYNGYRQNVLTKLSQAHEVIERDPRLRTAVLGNELLNGFSKTASAPVLTRDSMAYLMGAYLERGLLSNSAVADAMAANGEWLFDTEDHV